MWVRTTASSKNSITEGKLYYVESFRHTSASITSDRGTHLYILFNNQCAHLAKGHKWTIVNTGMPKGAIRERQGLRNLKERMNNG